MLLLNAIDSLNASLIDSLNAIAKCRLNAMLKSRGSSTITVHVLIFHFPPKMIKLYSTLIDRLNKGSKHSDMI